MFLIVYDDVGGAYDHVVPPFEGVPDDEAPCRAPCADFDFRRLGSRAAALLMGPRIPKGVVNEPKAGPFKTSQFEHSSVPATVKS
jgi:phospholipase C